jgi:hypothetical protein
VPAALSVVVAFRDGDKRLAKVVDMSTGGMHLEADRIPDYGETVTLVVQLHESDDWHLIPAMVRWVGSQRFGLAFENLDARQERALASFVGDEPKGPESRRESA